MDIVFSPGGEEWQFKFYRSDNEFHPYHISHAHNGWDKEYVIQAVTSALPLAAAGHRAPNSALHHGGQRRLQRLHCKRTALCELLETPSFDHSVTPQ